MVDRPQLRGNLIDRIVTYVNPAAGLERIKSRLTLGASGAYTGASRDDKAMREWRSTRGSADADSITDLPTLRSRSRDLIRNNPIAAGAVATNVRNTIGTGLIPRPQPDANLLGLTREQAAEWARQAKRIFWAFAGSCDVERKQPFWAMQALALQSELESGDIFVIRRFVIRPGDILGLKLQTIEADRVSNPRNRPDTPTLVAGVEMDQYGAPTAYHVLNRHPGDRIFAAADEWESVPAFDAVWGWRKTLHLYRRKRPGQTRGIPYLAPVIASLKQLGRYHDAEVMAAVLAGMNVAAITTSAEDDRPQFAAGESQTAIGEQNAEDAERGEIKFEYGQVWSLDPGESVELLAANRPNVAFDSFVQAFCRYVGAALELPFELLILHFQKSYSAARATLLEAWKYFRTQRDHIAFDFCQPVYEWVITEAVARRLIDAPGFLKNPLVRQAWLNCDWRGPSAGQLDPLKEVQAAKERLQLVLSTRDQETAELTGGDFEDNVAQGAHELKLLQAAGLTGQPLAEEPAPEQPEDTDEADEREVRDA